MNVGKREKRENEGEEGRRGEREERRRRLLITRVVQGRRELPLNDDVVDYDDDVDYDVDYDVGYDVDDVDDFFGDERSFSAI